MGWTLLAETVPLYPLYALLFAEHGMSAVQISVLFAVWSVTGLLTEVPAGAVSDRFSRRRVLAVGGVLQAAAYTVWLLAPGFTGFAVGFVVWGLGTSLFSGTVEALLYEGLATDGRSADFGREFGLVTAADHVAQLPSAGIATACLFLGGIELAGWASVVTCLLAVGLTWTFPDPPRTSDEEDEKDDDYADTLREGLREAVGSRVVRSVLLAAALAGGIDALEEYFPLIVGQGEDLTLVPTLLLVVAAAGGLGAVLGGRLRMPVGLLVLLCGLALYLTPVLGLGALAVHYGLQQAARVSTEARVQERLSGRARATTTSVAALGTEVVALGVFAAWGLGGTAAVALGILAAAPLVFWLLRARER